MVCNKCKEMIVMHAFSESNCIICGEEITTAHIPSYKACKECSEELNLCQKCGKELTSDEIDIDCQGCNLNKETACVDCCRDWDLEE